MKPNVSEVQAGIFSYLTEELVINHDFLKVILLYFAKNTVSLEHWATVSKEGIVGIYNTSFRL